jgi:hypothetical protein
MELFPVLPDDLSGLSADELTALLDETVATCDKVASGDIEVEGSKVDALQQGVEIAETLRAEMGVREEKAAKEAEQVEALRARLHAADEPAEPEADAEPEGDAEPEPDEPDAGEPDPEPADEPAPEPEADTVDEPQAVAAASRLPARRSSRSTPTPVRPELVTITAAADIPGRPMGSRISSKRELADAFAARFRGLGRSTVQGENVPVATIHADYPDERVLRRGADEQNTSKITALREQIQATPMQSIVAAGGLCAPVEPYYGLKQIATTQRPVRDGMARFGADRGGIRFAPPPAFTDFVDSITFITAADDASGGSAAVKACMEVDCAEFQEVTVDIVAHCLTFHNLTARAWPEQVENAVANTMAIHARVAETALLDDIAAGSTHVTAAHTLGTSAEWPEEIIRAAAAYRSRHRTAPDLTLRVLAPFWARDMVLSDMIKTQFYRQSSVAEALDQKFAMANVAVSWYLDTPTGASQVFPAQSAGALTAYPSTIVWYLFDEGGWLFLDGGALELGLVRDSVLNALNEYTMFGETFEGAAFTGIESLQVTSTTSTTGQTACCAS